MSRDLWHERHREDEPAEETFQSTSQKQLQAKVSSFIFHHRVPGCRRREDHEGNRKQLGGYLSSLSKSRYLLSLDDVWQEMDLLFLHLKTDTGSPVVACPSKIRYD